jgi:predicted ATP-dependent endonuclease of OLD family
MVMQMDDAEATIAMIDSNLQRGHIRTSEKAFAYKKKLEAGGELFFAKGWLMAEGQTEAVILPYFAITLGYDLDERGISYIEYRSNG